MLHREWTPWPSGDVATFQVGCDDGLDSNQVLTVQGVVCFKGDNTLYLLMFSGLHMETKKKIARILKASGLQT